MYQVQFNLIQMNNQTQIIENNLPPSPSPNSQSKLFPINAKPVKQKISGKSLPLYLYQGKQLQDTKYYNILVIGEMSSGKTTLLDTLLNKLEGINFQDNWRWTLSEEDGLNEPEERKIGTSQIKTYYINDINNQFNLRIFDTPGLGNRQDLSTDDQIMTKLQRIFQVANQIDFILLTMDSRQMLIRPQSRYIFYRIQQLFGQDMKQRFVLICTFSDGVSPWYQESFSKDQLLFSNFFTFNSVQTYIPSINADQNTKIFWQMHKCNIVQLENFAKFRNLASLNVLRSKENLKNHQNLSHALKKYECKWSFLESELNYKYVDIFYQWKSNKNLLERNSQYIETISRQVKRYKSVPICQKCKVTCCQVCAWPQGQLMSSCTYFNNNGLCPKCPGKCPRQTHVRKDQIVGTDTIKEQVVNQYKKNLYQQGKYGIQFCLSTLSKNKVTDNDLTNKILPCMRQASQVKRAIQIMQRTALQPNLWTYFNCFQQIIKSQEQRKTPGYANTVIYFVRIMIRDKTCLTIFNQPTINDLSSELKQFQDELSGFKDKK